MNRPEVRLSEILYYIILNLCANGSTNKSLDSRYLKLQFLENILQTYTTFFEYSLFFKKYFIVPITKV